MANSTSTRGGSSAASILNEAKPAQKHQSNGWNSGRNIKCEDDKKYGNENMKDREDGNSSVCSDITEEYDARRMISKNQLEQFALMAEDLTERLYQYRSQVEKLESERRELSLKLQQTVEEKNALLGEHQNAVSTKEEQRQRANMVDSNGEITVNLCGSSHVEINISASKNQVRRSYGNDCDNSTEERASDSDTECRNEGFSPRLKGDPTEGCRNRLMETATMLVEHLNETNGMVIEHYQREVEKLKLDKEELAMKLDQATEKRENYILETRVEHKCCTNLTEFLGRHSNPIYKCTVHEDFVPPAVQTNIEAPTFTREGKRQPLIKKGNRSVELLPEDIAFSDNFCSDEQIVNYATKLIPRRSARLKKIVATAKKLVEHMTDINGMIKIFCSRKGICCDKGELEKIGMMQTKIISALLAFGIKAKRLEEANAVESAASDHKRNREEPFDVSNYRSWQVEQLELCMADLHSKCSTVTFSVVRAFFAALDKQSRRRDQFASQTTRQNRNTDIISRHRHNRDECKPSEGRGNACANSYLSVFDQIDSLEQMINEQLQQENDTLDVLNGRMRYHTLKYFLRSDSCKKLDPDLLPSDTVVVENAANPSQIMRGRSTSEAKESILSQSRSSVLVCDADVTPKDSLPDTDRLATRHVDERNSEANKLLNTVNRGIAFAKRAVYILDDEDRQTLKDSVASFFMEEAIKQSPSSKNTNRGGRSAIGNVFRGISSRHPRPAAEESISFEAAEEVTLMVDDPSNKSLTHNQV